jgi:Fur family peroxide stress response transcriptional regulator
MLEALAARGLKRTPQRLALIQELANDPSHPTAMGLYERLRTTMPTMSFATVYNTLSALCEQGLCTARALEPGPVRFDPNVAPHDHAVCDGCGRVIDVSVGSPSAHAVAVAGFAVRAVERIYRGRCDECAALVEHAAVAEYTTGD